MLQVREYSVKKRTSKRKAFITGYINRSPLAGIKLFREVRYHTRLHEKGVGLEGEPEYYTRSFNRTIRDNYQTFKVEATQLSAGLIFRDIYFEMIETRVISHNFPKEKLNFYIVGYYCLVIAKIEKGAACQVFSKRILSYKIPLITTGELAIKELSELHALTSFELIGYQLNKFDNSIKLNCNEVIEFNGINCAYLPDSDLFFSKLSTFWGTS